MLSLRLLPHLSLFPEQYSQVLYQDLIESIKVQVESKQVVPGDYADINNICR